MNKLQKCLPIVFLLFGCTSESLQDRIEKPYLLFATPLRDHLIWLQAKEGFLDACDFYDLHCDWIGPNTIDTNKMNDVIESGILQRADGIITQGVIDENLIRRAEEKGIPLILVDSDQPDSDRFAYMGKDFKQQAELLLEDIEKQYGKDKELKIAIQVAESEFTIAKQQIAQIKEVFQTHKGGFELLDVSESKSDNVRAKREWKQVLSEYTDVNVAINFAAESAEACSETALEQDVRDQILIYGADDMPATIEMIKNGSLDGSIVTSFYDYGYQSVEMIVAYHRYGTKPQQKVQSPVLMIVNQDNVNSYKDVLYGK